MRREYPITEKIDPIARRHHLTLARMERQTQCGQVVAHGFFDRPQTLLVVAEDDKVVAITQVGLTTQLLLHEMVEPVQIHVGKKLTGQVADGNAPPPDQRTEQVITLEMPTHELLLITRRNNQPHQPEHLRVLDLTFEKCDQDLMVDAGKVFRNIAFEDIAKPPGLGAELGHRQVGPLAHATGIGVLDKGPVEDRLNDAAERMVHHTIPIGRRADQS